jgi:hypothetical protein
VGTAPTYHTGSISLSATTELVAASLNTTAIPSLAANSTILVRLKFDSSPNPTGLGFLFGFTNQTTPGSWGQMIMTSWCDNNTLGQYSNTTQGTFGGSNAFGVPATGAYFTMALVYTSGHDANGYPNSSLSEFQTFINGSQVATGSATGTVMSDIAFALGQLGINCALAPMTLSQVQVYNSSLTEAQIPVLSNPALSSFGVNEEPDVYSDYQALVTQIIASGVHWVRIAPSWGWVIPQNGVWNTAELANIDYVVNTLTANGVNIDFVLCYAAPWDSTNQSNPSTAPFYPPLYQGDWENWVTYITARYKGKVHDWEVWNEEDGGGFWLGTMSQYYTQLQTAANAARAVDPTNQILLGGLATNTNGVDNYGVGGYFDQLLALGAASYFDIVNYHSYGDSSRQFDVYEGMMSVVNKYNIQNKPIWITETGYTTNGNAIYEPTKADYIDGVYTMNTRFPNVARTFIYNYRNTTSGYSSEDYFGLVLSNSTPLPALAHFQALGQAQANFSLEANYPSQTPSTLTLYYIPMQTGDGAYVTNYNASGTQKQIAAGTYMYFAVNDNWIYQGNQGLDSTVNVDVTYLDSGTGTFWLQYDSTSGAYTGKPWTMTNTGGWRTATFAITDAYFADRENNGADFRLFAANGAALVISNVDVRKQTGTGGVILMSTNTSYPQSPDFSKLMSDIIDTNPADEAYAPPAVMGGLSCREILGNSNYCYFQVNQGLVSPQDNNIQVGITFWDAGPNSILLQYNGTSAYEADWVAKTNTNTWRTVWLTISDAVFKHSENYSADMRIGNGYDNSVEYIRAVTVLNPNISNPLH